MLWQSRYRLPSKRIGRLRRAALPQHGGRRTRASHPAMSYAPKIVLQLPLSNPDRLPDFVEACIRDQVALIAVVGEDASEIHDRIDELIVGDGSDTSRFILTSFHTDETRDEVMMFVKISQPEGTQAIEQVRL
jgi:hypothetical protein